MTAYVNGESTIVPMAVITVPETSKYLLVDSSGAETSELCIPLAIYKNQLKKNILYICVEEPSYTGEQIMPSGEAVRVYTGSPQAVKAASQAKEKNDSILTDPNQSYKLTRLSEGKDYTLSYGKNVAAGKNKGSLTVNGLAPQYGGSVQVKFTILGKGIYK